MPNVSDDIQPSDDANGPELDARSSGHAVHDAGEGDELCGEEQVDGEDKGDCEWWW